MGRMSRKSSAAASGFAIAIALSLAAGVPAAGAQETGAAASVAEAGAAPGIPEWGIVSSAPVQIRVVPQVAGSD